MPPLEANISGFVFILFPSSNHMMLPTIVSLKDPQLTRLNKIIIEGAEIPTANILDLALFLFKIELQFLLGKIAARSIFKIMLKSLHIGSENYIVGN